MADFEDISGWREELAAFERTEEGKAYFGEYGAKPSPKLPFETVLHVGELMQRHEELHQAVTRIVAWEKFLDEHPELDQEADAFWDNNPTDATDTLFKFVFWYGMKTRVPFDSAKLLYGEWLLKYVETGQLPSLRSEQTRDFAKSKLSKLISFAEDPDQ
ncbi:hypothetical protein [Roseibium sp. Sym1]|uniref:hypothetical protein n=1 Tax=Roseibium sp. Sym1 TaxID=3016006 RepID=UPI0022B4E33D|nr:hypothetical protein [Roseibium sp. Sym1]